MSASVRIRFATSRTRSPRIERRPAYVAIVDANTLRVGAGSTLSSGST
jgi:hypothetical protein